jgi:FPC/CPF motif-containing protein YcgG
VRPDEITARTADEQALLQRFRHKMLDPAFPCLGGASAVRRGDYDFASFSALGDRGEAQSSAERLIDFLSSRPADHHPVTVFAAVFAGSAPSDDAEFETLLFTHLRRMQEHDPVRGRSDPSTPQENQDPGWIFAGRHLFVVGMHARSHRRARRFELPMLVFNALSHVQPLREAGQFERMSSTIRMRDERLQGSPNPALDLPRPAQFSGRMNATTWVCPIDLNQGPHE